MIRSPLSWGRPLVSVMAPAIILSMLSGCLFVPRQFRVLPSGHYWPKNERWTIGASANTTNHTTSGFDSDVVYLQRSSTNWCHLYRFWPSGHALCANMSFPLDVEKLERFCDGASYLGYYAIEDGQLFVEIYGPEGTTS